MRFITEYKQDDTNWDKNPSIIGYRKMQAEEKIGHLIANTFGWTERGETMLDATSFVILTHTLDIEAFPMDKWVEFKNRLFGHIDFCNEEDRPVDEIRVLQLIKELESFGKPAGEAKDVYNEK
jgi:hypothetical protein